MKNKGIPVSLFFILISLVGITLRGGPLTYIFFFTSALIPLLSLSYILIVFNSLKIYQRSDGRNMTADTPTDFYITLHNEGWFSFSAIRLSFYSSFSNISDIDESVTYELPPKSSITKKTRIVCFYRGEYKVGIKEITIRDYLNLFEIKFKIKEPLSAIVVPFIKRIPETAGKEMSFDENRENLNRKTEPDIPVREYVPGDDIRLLNHRSSAAMQKYMVREKRGQEKSGIAIVLDPGRYQKTEEEYLPVENREVERLISLSLYYMENNVPVDVILKDRETECTSVQNMTDFEGVYGKMCRYMFRKEESLSLLSLDIGGKGGLFGYRMLIFILSKLDDEDENAIDLINTNRVPVRIYLIGNDENEVLLKGRDKDIVKVRADVKREEMR